MKKIYSLIFVVYVYFSANAQSFTQNGNVHIADNAHCYLFITVSGLPTTMDTTFGITSSCVNIIHSYDGDLKLFLISPQMDSIMLSNNNGGGGDNYQNTCFAENGSNGFINSASSLAPYSGNYVPEYSLNFFNTSGHNPNGTWKLMVLDEAPGDTGRVTSLSLTFGINPPHDPLPPPGPCGFNAVNNCHCPDGSTDCDLLPDMTASGKIIIDQHTEYPGYLTMSNATPNIGWGPMEIHGVDTCFCGTTMVPCSTTVCPSGEAVKQMVKQTIYHKNGNTMTNYTRTAGTMSYHPTHGHIHVDSWANFTLREANSDPNPLNWPIVGTGTKQSFCLINLGDCTNNPGYCVANNGDTLIMDSIPNAPLGAISGCGTDQGIYAGKLDIYSQGLTGQNIQFGNICNGDYYIVSVTDPDNFFLEQDETNNAIAVPITLTDQKPLPTADFNFGMNNETVAFAGDTTHTTKFWWDFGDGSAADSINLITPHTYTNNGTYIVHFYSMNSCGTTMHTDTINIITAGVKETTTNNNTQFFKIAPNPFNQSTEISYFLINGTETNIQIFDLLGNCVETVSSGYTPAGNYKYTFNPAEMGIAKGTYILKYLSNDKVNVSRLVFE